MRKDHLGIIRQWCVSLGVLTVVTITREEAEIKLGAYVPLLAREFPAEAFTADSLGHVAAASAKGFPTYGELVASLRVWWRDHRPTPPMLPSPPPPEPVHAAVATDEEREHIRKLVEAMTARVRVNAEDTVAAAPRFGARHLSAGQLDLINPLPNGRSRVTGGAS